MVPIKFPELHIGRGVLHGTVTVFPVWTAGAVVRGVAPACRLDANEVGSGGSVGRVRLGNPLDRPSLVLDGEVIEGGQQHRALVRSVILGPRAWHEVDVVCVEQGRWGGDSDFSRRGLRTSTRVRAGLRESAPGPRQQLTWHRVAELQQRTGTTSPTASFVDIALRSTATAEMTSPWSLSRASVAC